MRRSSAVTFLASVAVAVFSAAGQDTTQESGAKSAPAVLDAHSYWRVFVMFRPIVYAEKSAGVTAPAGQPWTDPPPSDWTGPDFDDSRWLRTCGPVFGGYGGARDGGAHETALLCLRGKFTVPDPSKVESLTLSATFRGGVLVYLNGAEVARSYLPEGTLAPDTVSEAYPWEAYVDGDGKSPLESRDRGLLDEAKRRLELRLRRLTRLAIPARGLRKGLNVLAMAVYRSPLHPQSKTMRDSGRIKWSTAGLGEISLTAAPSGSIECNTRRPKGVQVWNESPIADVCDLDYGDPNEPLRPVEMAGVRNGHFSGQIVVGSDAALEGLQAALSELKGADGKNVIAAENLRLFYPQPTGIGGQAGKSYGAFGRPRSRFDALAESPPAAVRVRELKPPSGYAGPLPAFGAVQPVRVTVHVPSGAAPGLYEGKLSVKAVGLNATEVPVRVKVIDWVLPDSTDLSSHLGLVQSIDSLAIQYQVPMWSEQHWKLIDRSFGILGRAGTDVLYLPLVMKHHWGKEALVRWVKNEDGSFSHDFSIFEKYVDVAMKHLKKPEVVCLYAWVREYVSVHRSRPANEPPPNVPVPLLDRKTHEVSEMPGPPYNGKESAAFWKPVLDGCRERLNKRGIEDEAIVIGLCGDSEPDPETVDMFCEVAPWAKWAGHAHRGMDGVRGTKTRVAAGYNGKVWLAPAPDPSQERRFGWQRAAKGPRVFAVFPRAGSPLVLRSETCMAAHWVLQETYMTVGVRGVARIGAEFWQVMGEGKSRRTSLVSYYDTPVPTMDCAVIDLLAPGPDGALSTARLETMYEGAQEAEARAFIEKALQTQKDKLALDGMSAAQTHEKLQRMLDERLRVLIAYRPIQEWYAGSGWEKRTEDLYEAAGQVAEALGAK